MRESNLFNLLRYPISEPPTSEELEALPDDLYMNWLIDAGFGNAASWPDAETVADYLDEYWDEGRDVVVQQDLDLLRKMISEYKAVQLTSLSH
jgi:hypothetical protein